MQLPRWTLFLAAGAGALGIAIWRRKDVEDAVDTAVDAAATLLDNITQKPAFAANFKAGRSAAIDTIVIHTTEGSKASAANWFAMDHGTDPLGPSSSHYIIGQDGQIIQSVAVGDTAYHAGNSAVNARSIGIELEGYAAKADTFTPAMMDSLVALVKSFTSTYPIPIGHQQPPGILGHVDVAQKTASKHTDPGIYFPWNDFLARLA